MIRLVRITKDWSIVHFKFPITLSIKTIFTANIRSSKQEAFMFNLCNKID